jgi:DNA-binding response OmpR family regulator
MLKQSTSAIRGPVLLVDDEPYIVEMLASEMQERGIEFLSTSNGNDALEMIEKKNPSVIVSDYKMPGLNGIELLKYLRNLGSHAPVIWITGNADDETRKEAWKLGAFHLFRKPFDPGEVASEIVKALRIGPDLWEGIQPTFSTEALVDLQFQKVLIEIDNMLYRKVKEHCLKNSISLNGFIINLLTEHTK